MDPRCSWLVALVMISVADAWGGSIVVQHVVPRSGAIVLSDSIAVPAHDAGYTLIVPDDRDVVGTIVFFGRGRDTTYTGFEMNLFRVANPRGVAVINLTTGNPLDFFFEDSTLATASGLVRHAIDTHGLPRRPLLFTGMSLGGTRALRLALYGEGGRSADDVRADAIAVCDAPVDFVRLWRQCRDAMAARFHPIATAEAEWVRSYLESGLGGTPRTDRKAYETYSPFCYSAAGPGNEVLLRELPLRAYTEPDVQWWIDERRKDYYGMNAIDAAALVNALRLLGNDRAELVLTEGLGRHPDGRRHPHSWSIVDGAELVEWFLAVTADSGSRDVAPKKGASTRR